MRRTLSSRKSCPNEHLCGEGEHVYVTFRRSGWNTADAAKAIQKRLNLKPSDVGWGGRKDKTAVVEQTLSFRCGIKRPLSDIEDAFADLPFELTDLSRHRNKIKTGHVAANRFTIIVSNPGPRCVGKGPKDRTATKDYRRSELLRATAIWPPDAEHPKGVSPFLVYKKGKKKMRSWSR